MFLYLILRSEESIIIVKKFVFGFFMEFDPILLQSYKKDYILRVKSSLIFQIFVWMSFFQLNSHISVILLEGGCIF